MSLKIEKRASVGWIVFDNPKRRNAINGAMWRGIPEAMARFRRRWRGALRRVPWRRHQGVLAGGRHLEFDKARAERGSVAEYDDLLDGCCTRSRTRSSPPWR